jgi:hypothetical protein
MLMAQREDEEEQPIALAIPLVRTPAYEMR